MFVVSVCCSLSAVVVRCCLLFVASSRVCCLFVVSCLLFICSLLLLFAVCRTLLGECWLLACVVFVV